MAGPEFISIARYLKGGHMMDLDWLWDTLDREDPLDVQAASTTILGQLFSSENLNGF